MLGKLSAPSRPAKLDNSRARASALAEGAGEGCLGIFSLVYLFSFLSPCLWETARYRLKYCLKGSSSLKQPTNLCVASTYIISAKQKGQTMIYTRL